MADVRILHGGGVGSFKKGEVVKNAPEGLVQIAEKGIRNAADGELVAEIVVKKRVLLTKTKTRKSR